MCNLRRAGEQGSELTLGTACGVLFQRFTTGEHQNNDEAGPVLAHQHRGDDGRDSQHIYAPLAVHDRAHHRDRLDARNDERKDADDPGRSVIETEQGERSADEPDRHGCPDGGVGKSLTAQFVHGRLVTGAEFRLRNTSQSLLDVFATSGPGGLAASTALHCATHVVLLFLAFASNSYTP